MVDAGVYTIVIRRNDVDLHVPVPASLEPRHEKLLQWLNSEGWHLRGRTSVSGRGPLKERERHAAELVFVRDVLPLLRRKVRRAVPEKAVGMMLGIGVKLLHERIADLFGDGSYAEFTKTVSQQQGFPMYYTLADPALGPLQPPPVYYLRDPEAMEQMVSIVQTTYDLLALVAMSAPHGTQLDPLLQDIARIALCENTLVCK